MDPGKHFKIIIFVLSLACFFVIGLFMLTTNIYGITLPELEANNPTTTTGGASGGELAKADALTLDQIKKILADEGTRGKNLKPHAEQIYNAAHKFNINPLFALAMYTHESGLGTAGAGETCRNPGNISKRSDDYKKSGISGLGRCSTVYGGSKRWEAFKTYGDGVQAQMWLLRVNYLDKGFNTLPKIIHKYAPGSDGNNEGAYVNFIKKYMKDNAP